MVAIVEQVRILVFCDYQPFLIAFLKQERAEIAVQARGFKGGRFRGIHFLLYSKRLRYKLAQIRSPGPNYNMLDFYLRLLLLVGVAKSISFNLARNRQTCIKVPAANTYDFEFVVSGQNEDRVQFTIESRPGEVIRTIQGTSHHEEQLQFFSDQGRVCFTPLDALPKVVSFDLLGVTDPLRSKIVNQDLEQLSLQMDALYFNMEKLYRDQHFYYDRNRVHDSLLAQLDAYNKYAKIWKVLLIALGALVQYLIIRKIIDKRSRGRAG